MEASKKITRAQLSEIKTKRAACIFLLMIIAAFIGWAAENAVKLVSGGTMDNRYHILPFIFPYGFAFLAMHLALGNTNDIGVFGKKVFSKHTKLTVVLSNVLYLVIVCAFVFIGELGAGNAYEAATGASLWDYSAQPLHFTKYVCLASVLGYGAGAYLLLKFFFYPVLHALEKKGNLKAVVTVNNTLGTLVVLDCILMIAITLITKTPPVYWTVTI